MNVRITEHMLEETTEELKTEADQRVSMVIRQFEWAVSDVTKLRDALKRAQDSQTETEANELRLQQRLRTLEVRLSQAGPKIDKRAKTNGAPHAAPRTAPPTPLRTAPRTPPRTGPPTPIRTAARTAPRMASPPPTRMAARMGLRTAPRKRRAEATGAATGARPMTHTGRPSSRSASRPALPRLGPASSPTLLCGSS